MKNGCKEGNTVFTYELDTTSTYFIQGAGRVSASLNSIRVKDATHGGVILKYHWLETFRAIPEMPLRRYPLPDDSVGFIEVDNGTTSEFQLFNSYNESKFK